MTLSALEYIGEEVNSCAWFAAILTDDIILMATEMSLMSKPLKSNSLTKILAARGIPTEVDETIGNRFKLNG
ncbi:MAG: hypothetical protein GYA55_11890 [SAR324 cluster bacterium]|uniref:Uncharacterized protein n=1 Tax=SAR324 cluster bacterium TaxID=2024889 RepID=A0A7X9IMB8_9DELT|nr:hypothetical protein [SAR324 cluster bacterium]